MKRSTSIASFAPSGPIAIPVNAAFRTAVTVFVLDGVDEAGRCNVSTSPLLRIPMGGSRIGGRGVVFDDASLLLPLREGDSCDTLSDSFGGVIMSCDPCPTVPMRDFMRIQ